MKDRKIMRHELDLESGPTLHVEHSTEDMPRLTLRTMGGITTVLTHNEVDWLIEKLTDLRKEMF